MANSSKRPLAVFQTNKVRKIGDFVIKVMGIKTDIASDPARFATPNPPLAVLQADLDTLGTAQARAQTRVAGSAADRDVAYDRVVDDVNVLLGYVQQLADNAADEQAAIAIIQASGFDLKNKGVRVKPPLSAQNTTTSGTVKLIAKAVSSRASYNWQYSTDNGSTWQDLPTTLQANTTASGFTPASRVLFRSRGIEATGSRSWCAPVSLIIT